MTEVSGGATGYPMNGRVAINERAKETLNRYTSMNCPAAKRYRNCDTGAKSVSAVLCPDED